MVTSNNAINNTVGASISGVTNTLTVTNPSNTAASVARATVVVGGGTAGDPTVNWNVSGVTNWEMGIDNSDSDKWKLSQGTALGTNDTVTVDTSGRVLKPLQPSFLAYVNTTIPNVTGDGTEYEVKFDTELFDIGSNFDLGSSIFTAPVSGIYSFSFTCTVGDLVVAHTSGAINFRVNGTTLYQGNSGNPAAQSGFGLVGWTIPLVVQLSANDQISCVIRVSNGAKVIDVAGAASFGGIRSTYFSGYLLG